MTAKLGISPKPDDWKARANMRGRFIRKFGLSVATMVLLSGGIAFSSSELGTVNPAGANPTECVPYAWQPTVYPTGFGNIIESPAEIVCNGIASQISLQDYLYEVFPNGDPVYTGYSGGSDQYNVDIVYVQNNAPCYAQLAPTTWFTSDVGYDPVNGYYPFQSVFGYGACQYFV